MKILLTTTIVLGIVFMLEANQSLKATAIQSITPLDDQGQILLVAHGGHFGGGHWEGGHGHWGGRHGGGAWIGVPFYGPSYPYEDPYYYEDDPSVNVRIGPLDLVN